MERKIMQVFYNGDCYPFKDVGRTVRYPIVGNSFAGASDTTAIRFYVGWIGGTDSVEWISVAKLPNGKKGYTILEKGFDDEINEQYVELRLSSFYTQAKGDLYIGLQGFFGGVEVEYDEDDNMYKVSGTPTVQTTGAIKLSINYSPDLVPQDIQEYIDLDDILATLGTKLDKKSNKYVHYIANAYEGMEVSSDDYNVGDIVIGVDTGSFNTTDDILIVYDDSGTLRLKTVYSEFRTFYKGYGFTIGDENDSSWVSMLGNPDTITVYKDTMLQRTNTFTSSTYPIVFDKGSGVDYRIDRGSSLALTFQSKLHSGSTWKSTFQFGNNLNSSLVDFKISDSDIGITGTPTNSIATMKGFIFSGGVNLSSAKLYKIGLTGTSDNPVLNLVYNNNDVVVSPLIQFTKDSAIFNSYTTFNRITTFDNNATFREQTSHYDIVQLGYYDPDDNDYIDEYEISVNNDKELTLKNNTLNADILTYDTTNGMYIYALTKFGNDVAFENNVEINYGYLLNVDNSDSTSLVNKDYVDNAIASAVASSYVYKGTKNVSEINALDTSSLVIGWVYNVSNSGTITLGSLNVNAGDNIAWTGSAWDILAGTVDLSNYYTKSETNTLLGGKQNTIDSTHKISSDLVDDTSATNKFVSASDITKLNGIESGAQVNVIETISVNNVALTPTNKAVNIDLSGKQDTLVSGTNIKSINNESIVGSGNFNVNGFTYETTAPTEDNTSGILKVVFLTSEPSTKYNGYLYLIGE